MDGCPGRDQSLSRERVARILYPDVFFISAEKTND